MDQQHMHGTRLDAPIISEYLYTYILYCLKASFDLSQILRWLQRASSISNNPMKLLASGNSPSATVVFLKATHQLKHNHFINQSVNEGQLSITVANNFSVRQLARSQGITLQYHQSLPISPSSSIVHQHQVQKEPVEVHPAIYNLLMPRIELPKEPVDEQPAPKYQRSPRVLQATIIHPPKSPMVFTGRTNVQEALANNQQARIIQPRIFDAPGFELHAPIIVPKHHHKIVKKRPDKIIFGPLPERKQLRKRRTKKEMNEQNE